MFTTELRGKVFDTTLYIVFTKWYISLPPLPEKKILTGFALASLYLAYSLAQLLIMLKTLCCSEFRKVMLSKISLSSIILGMKFGIAEFLFDSVFSSS